MKDRKKKKVRTISSVSIKKTTHTRSHKKKKELCTGIYKKWYI